MITQLPDAHQYVDPRYILANGQNTIITGNTLINTGPNNFKFSSTISSRPQIIIENINIDSSGPSLVLWKKSIGSAADDDALGHIYFVGLDSGDGTTTYVDIVGQSADVTHLDEAGKLDFQFIMDGTNGVSFLKMSAYNGAVNEGSIVFNDGSRDIDFRVESDNDANAFFIQGSDGKSGFGTATPNARVDIKSAGNSTVVFNCDSSLDNDSLFYVYQDADGDGLIRLQDAGANITFQAHSNGDNYFNGGPVFMSALKSGANQAAAGAAVNELWHDTNDNSIKIGV